MAFDAGELFVEIRPVTTGFTEAAAGPIGKAGRDLSKVFLAAFAVGGAVEAIKSVIDAATKQQTAFAVLDQVLKNAGLTAAGFSASLKDKLEVQARATGVSAEDLAAAMDRLIPATHNSQKALADLNTAIGISETYHISLSTAALALAKTETGSFNSLQRYLGLIPRVTTNVDALKASYAEMVQQGGKLDATQKAQYDSALKTAQAQDKVLTSQQALALATQKFGGVAQTFATTYAGEFARLHVNIDQLKVAIGTELVGGLASAAGSVDNFLSKLLESNRVQTDAKQAAHDFGTALHEVGSFLGTVGPPLVSVTESLGGFVRVGEIAAALFVGNKLLGWIGSLGATAAAEATATAGTATLTAALEANTAALAANTAALGADAAALTVLGGTAEAAASKVGLVAKGLATLLIANQAIKALVPGQGDLGLDFSNNTAGFTKGDHGSPYQKNSPDDLLYQRGFLGRPSTVTKAQLDSAFNFAAIQAQQAYEKGAKALAATTKDAAGGGPGSSGAGGGAFISAFLAPILGTESQVKNAIALGTAANSSVIQSLRQGIATDKTDLTQLGIDMADAITQGTQQIANAVQSAKQSLNTIGQDLATSLANYIDKPLNDEAQALSDAHDKITARFDLLTAGLTAQGTKLARAQAELGLTAAKQNLANLGTSVALPGGGRLSADPKEALAQLERLQKTSAASPALDQFIAQYRTAYLTVQQDQLGLRTSAIDARRQALETSLQLKSDALKLTQDLATHEKTAAAQRIADLTDEFNKHAITYEQLQRRVTNVLVAAGVSRKTVTARLGVAAGDQLAGQLTGLGLQAGALLAGPQQAGTGLIPSIVRPLDTVNQVQKQIATIASQERAKQLAETKSQTELLKKIHGAQATSAFVGSLDKNPGAATRRQSRLSGVGS